MRRVVGKPYSNQDIKVDGIEFVDCNFQSCRLIYSGRASFKFVGSSFSSDCELKLRGRAADVVDALTSLYAIGDWGRNNVSAALCRVAPDIATWETIKGAKIA